MTMFPQSDEALRKTLQSQQKVAKTATRSEKIGFLFHTARTLMRDNKLGLKGISWSRKHNAPEHMVVTRYGSVFMAYKVQYWYGDIVEMIRKVLLTSVVNFIFPRTHLQLGVGMLVMVMSMYYTLDRRPFVLDSLNSYQSWAFFLIILNGIYGFMLMVNQVHDQPLDSVVSGPVPYVIVIFNCTVIFQPVCIAALRVLLCRDNMVSKSDSERDEAAKEQELKRKMESVSSLLVAAVSRSSQSPSLEGGGVSLLSAVSRESKEFPLRTGSTSLMAALSRDGRDSSFTMGPGGASLMGAISRGSNGASFSFEGGGASLLAASLDISERPRPLPSAYARQVRARNQLPVATELVGEEPQDVSGDSSSDPSLTKTSQYPTDAVTFNSPHFSCEAPATLATFDSGRDTSVRQNSVEATPSAAALGRAKLYATPDDVDIRDELMSGRVFSGDRMGEDETSGMQQFGAV